MSAINPSGVIIIDTGPAPSGALRTPTASDCIVDIEFKMM